jgi:hypothetical protein
VPEVDPDLLAMFNALTEHAAECRRRSYGARSRERQTDENGRTYYALLSQDLMSISQMVKRHPELKAEYQEWRSLYPTFTSD